MAAVPLVLIASVRSRGARIGWKREAALALAGFALAAHFATWIASLLYTSVAISTLLVTTTPLWTSLYDLFVTRARPSRDFVVALALASAGAAAIAFARAGAAPVPGHALLGDALALIGGIAMGVYLIVVRRSGVTPSAGPALSTTAIVARTYSWAALTLLLATVPAHQPLPAFTNYAAWLGILGMGVFSQLLGHTALNAALRDFSASIVAMSTLIEPLAAAILAALLFGEALSAQTIAGGLAVLAAVALSLGRQRVIFT
ncbi:MAG: DMT family transporter [Candidatus Eremiobacteraeota bacterium]|nr:DMT family transporter [Candidatus Eremiobacteraeota bacterium]